MNENLDSQKSAALKRLAECLTAFNHEGRVISPTESDMLSLIVSGTLNGENLAQRYPDFHKKLLENAELRQAFLDALDSLEAERDGDLIPMPAPDTRLDFLTSQPPAPNVIHLDEENWKVLWLRPLAQIQAIFSPPELVYRAEQSLIEEPWVTLLREEIQVSGNTYSVTLECTPVEEEENALAVFVSLAVTPDVSREPVKFPLRARLAWGAYQEEMMIPAEGRTRCPNISFDTIFDPATGNLTDGLSLTLETAS
jgi:hypothetical protein